MVATGCRNDARLRNLAVQEIGEGAARLEGTGVLQQFQLSTTGAGGRPKSDASVRTSGVHRMNGRIARSTSVIRCCVTAVSVKPSLLFGRP